MEHDNPLKRSVFLNRRDWSSYLSALQSAASYPKVLEAVKSGRAWFTQSATQASHWLTGGSSELVVEGSVDGAAELQDELLPG